MAISSITEGLERLRVARQETREHALSLFKENSEGLDEVLAEHKAGTSGALGRYFGLIDLIAEGDLNDIFERDVELLNEYVSALYYARGHLTDSFALEAQSDEDIARRYEEGLAKIDNNLESLDI